MRERADGMLEATSFEEHMDPGVKWVDDPLYAKAFTEIMGVPDMPDQAAQPAEADGVEAGVVQMMSRDHARMRKAGTALAEAALYTVREYDGLHRLSLAVADWSKALADEGDRAATPKAPATDAGKVEITARQRSPIVADYGENYLVARVSNDGKLVGIDHPCDAVWSDVMVAHVALRDYINERIARQDACPFKAKALATPPVPNDDLRAALEGVRAWVASLTVTDMNEIVADGGITAGMVVGQEATEQLRRIDRALKAPATDAAGEKVWRLARFMGEQTEREVTRGLPLEGEVTGTKPADE